jgi:hypothetical protein
MDTLNENERFILRRLRLAQSLLEESDRLPGREGYAGGAPEWWRHPRHEREALVSYLLLTCFDKLGQERGFTTFRDWLRSKKVAHVCERKDVIEQLEGAPVLEVASALADRYQELYGVKNAFYGGLERLPPDDLERLLVTIQIAEIPGFDSYPPNVSPPNRPLADKALERQLKMRHLYEKRNRFTHRLEQHQSSSVPLMSNFAGSQGASWFAIIQDSKLTYGGVEQETVVLPNGDAHGYSIVDWPFALFEVVYAAIGLPFERTSIDLLFTVHLHNNKFPEIVLPLTVRHAELKDLPAIEQRAWAEYVRRRSS